MDPRFQTSFIPKKPIVSAAGPSSSSPINLLTLIATVLFVAAIALSGAAFFYKSLVEKQITESKATLDRAKGAFEPELINQIVRLDTRIKTAKVLLGSHIAVTPLFDFLSTVTLRSVRFKDFSFQYVSPTEVQVSMKGQAASYASVALQSDLLNTQRYLRQTMIGDMALEPSGLVSFTVSTVIDPSVVSYRAALDRSNVQTVPDTVQSASSTTQ